MSFDHPLGTERSARGGGVARDRRFFAAGEPRPAQATRWARFGLAVGLLVPLVAGVAMFAHPIAAACADQTAAQREWLYAIAGWFSAGGICIAAAVEMASRAQRGEIGIWRPLLGALGVCAVAATLFAAPALLFLIALPVLALAPALIALAAGWVLKVTFALGSRAPFSAEQLKRVRRMLWFEVIVWLPALFILAALLDNAYHDCS